MTTAGPSQDAVRSFFDSGTYLERNVIVPLRAQIVARFLADLRDGRVLDLGCGDGSISRPLLASHNRLTLVDFSAQMLQRARAATDPAAPVEFIQADLLAFSSSELYDAIICVGVLAHVPSVERVLAGIAGALRPGGRCVLQITDDSSLLGYLLNRYYRLHSRQRYRMNTMTNRDLLELAGHVGLVPLQSQRYGLLLPGLGRLPYHWEKRIETAVAARPALSWAAAELLICLHKPGGPDRSGGEG